MGWKRWPIPMCRASAARASSQEGGGGGSGRTKPGSGRASPITSPEGPEITVPSGPVFRSRAMSSGIRAFSTAVAGPGMSLARRPAQYPPLPEVGGPQKRWAMTMPAMGTPWKV